MIEDVDAIVRAHVDAGELDAATTRLLARYGPELHGFLRAIAGDDALADDALAVASEQLWLALPQFRWEASLRTWAYRIARNALHRLRRDPRRTPARNLPLSVADSVADLQRTRTAPYQRTEIKDAFRALRDALDPLDHEILILRLDRQMSWRDIARALADDAEPADAVDQRAAAYRKRYERAKAQLRELAAARGLLGDDAT